MAEPTDDNPMGLFPEPTEAGWEAWWRERELEALAHRVQHHPPTPDAVDRHQAVRNAIAACGEALIAVLPPGAPETVGALVNLTDVVMAQANAAIARHVSGGPALEERHRRLVEDRQRQLDAETEAARHVEELGG